MPASNTTRPSPQDDWAALARLYRAAFGDTTPFALDLIITPDSERLPEAALPRMDPSGFNGSAIPVPAVTEETTSNW
jgi:hypothetical protein